MTDQRSERNLVELLAEEFLQRYRRGEHPALTEYTARHPEHADEIRELFPMLLDLEQALPDTDVHTRQNKGSEPPQQVGDYRIVREIGRGGMGIVYEAEQQSLGRSVALKILPSQYNQDQLAQERFRREARAAAKLHHTNIVPVFDVGQEGTTCYYTMQFIQGQPFDTVILELRNRMASGAAPKTLQLPTPMATDWLGSSPPSDTSSPEITLLSENLAKKATTVTRIRSTPAPSQATPAAAESAAATTSLAPSNSSVDDTDYRSYFRSVAMVGSQVSQALAYAHARGVVHRDIKPSNLLLDNNGVVWVTDFGMAKMDAEPLTRTGDILGTIHYMAPERFQGQCDSRADIYATGLTVYELLTLTPAFESSDRLRLVELIANHDPPNPRAVNERIPRDLETIVLKAIDKDPEHRYQTAAELADDFQCFLEDRPILARRESVAERFVRWTRRNPVLSGLSITIVLMLLLAAVGATITAIVLKESTDRAVAAEQDAAARASQLLEQTYINWVNLAFLEFRSDNVARAQEYLAKCPPEQRGWEWQFVASQCEVALRSTQERGHSVNCLDLSPDGAWMAIGTGNFLNRRGPPGDLIVRDIWTGAVRFSQEQLANGVTAVAFSPDGQQLASANGRRLVVWDAKTGDQLFSREGDAHDLLCLAFSPDGSIIAGGFGRFNGSHVGYVMFWNAATGEEIGERILGHAGGVWDLAFDPTGTKIALTSEGKVEVWSLEQREPVAELVADTGFIYCVAYHPDGRYVAAGGLDRTVRLWDVETGELIRTYSGHTGFVRGLAFSPDGKQMVSASEDKSVRLWRVGSEREIATLRGHTHFVNCVAFGDDGRIIASGSLDQSVKIWFAASQSQLVYRGHVEEGHVRALAFSPDRRLLATGSLRFPGPTGRLHLWDSDTGERLLRFPQRVEEVTSVVFRHDGARLAVGHVSGVVTVWNANTAELLLRLDAHVSEVHDVTYSRDGLLLASVGQDTGVNIWDAETGALVRTAVGHTEFITSVEFSPDGRTIATASEDKTVRLWETATARELLKLRHPSGEVRSVTYSPDGLRLVSTGGVDHRRGDVLIWDAATGRELDNLAGHTDIVYDVDFSPDGSRFATASDDRTIKLWDANSGREVFTMRGHTGGVLSVTFSSDGLQLASGSVDRTVRVWSLTPPDANVYLHRKAAAEFAQGQTLVAQRRWPEAVATLSRASELGIDQPDLHLQLALAHRANADSVGADEQLQQAVLRTPEDGRQLTSVALAVFRQGNADEAPGIIDRALQLAPDDPAVLAGAGRVHAVLEQLDRAEREFTQAIEQQAELHDGQAWWWESGWWTAASQATRPDEVGEAPSIASPIQRLVADTSEAPTTIRTVAWTTQPVDGDGYLDLRDPFGAESTAATYAIQHIYASTPQQVAFLVGADNEMQLWLNGQLSFQQTRARPARIGQHAVAVALRPGWNTVLAKLANQNGSHGMYFRISAHARDRARGAAAGGDLDQVLEIWSTASAAEQNDVQLLGIAASTTARRGRWQAAVEIFERLIERQPVRNRNWVSLAPLLVHTGKLSRYREYRSDLLAAFGDAKEPITAERTSKASLLVPVSAAEAELPQQLASGAVASGADHGLLPYFLFAQGMSAYRVGDFQAAVASLEESLVGNRSRWPYLDVVVHMFLAMSQQQLQNQTAASEHFDLGTKIFAEQLPPEDSTDFGPDWLDWLICEIARSEAQQTLFGPP